MPVSRRSLLATGAGSLLVSPALAAGRLKTTADFRITNAAVHPNQIWLHGSYPPPGHELPQSYQYTLDGGRNWKQAGGFAHDNGAWDTWINGIDLKPGTYTIAIRNAANHAEIAVAPGSYAINPNTAPANVSFNPIKFSTSLPTGSLIGVISASGGTPQSPLVLTSAAENSPGYKIEKIGDDKWQVSIGEQSRIRAGENRLAGKVESGHLSKPFSFTFHVAQGHVVPESALKLVQARRLTNATAIGFPAFRLAIEGYQGGTFSILSQEAPADPGGHMAARYTLKGAEGVTSNTLSAQKEPILFSWTDGINTCVAERSLEIASVLGTGPLIRISGQAALSAKIGDAQKAALGRYRGAVFLVEGGVYDAGWAMPGAQDGWDGNGFFGPQTIKGARGTLPIMEQTKSWIPNAKGWLETWGWDLDVIGLEFANLYQSYPGEVGNFAAIKLNAGVLGKTRVQYAYIHNCTDGVMGGEPGQVVELLDSEFAKCGGGDGYTHNFYLSAITRALVRRVVSWGANVGHCGKIRAASGLVEDSVFADGPFGSASYLLDLPDGGAHAVRNTIFEKGPHAQNGPMLRYGEETANKHPVNTLLVEGCSFINRVGSQDKLYNGDYVDPVAIQFGLADGRKAKAVVRNCTFYGLSHSQITRSDGPNASITMGSGNRFLPLSAAPAPSTYMRHPFAAGGYRTSTTRLAPYREGPMKGQ